MMNHILVKEGVLKSFSISKNVSTSEIRSLKKKLNKKFKPEELQSLVQKSIIEKNETIPGLIDSLPKATDKEKRTLAELSVFSSIIAKKMVEKKFDRYQACYIINVIINMLGLNEQDFDNFHKRFNRLTTDDSETPDTTEFS